MKKIFIAISVISILITSACQSDKTKVNQEASAMLESASEALSKGDLHKAISLTDSLHKAFPTAIDERKKALHIRAKALERQTLASMDSVDSELLRLQEAGTDENKMAMQRLIIERERLEKQLAVARSQVARTLPSEK